ncbi:hypothetical protein ACEPAG_9441 [Sanghuangporus baumii]
MSTQSHDTLPTSIPTLETSEKNWLLYSLHFQLAVKAKEKWGHFDGTKVHSKLAPNTVVAAMIAAGDPDPNLDFQD